MSLAQFISNGTSNSSFGTFTVNGATNVAVANTSVSLDSIILFSPQKIADITAIASPPFVAFITPGTGFTVRSVAADITATGVYNYVILHRQPQ